MSTVDTRQVNRDSLFLLARIRVDGRDGDDRVKVRNLSPGGMMAEGDVRVARGSRVSVELRNVGWVDGSVAWKQDNRFGIAFLEEIDAKLVRAHGQAEVPGTGFESPRYTRNYQPGDPATDPTRLRKI